MVVCFVINRMNAIEGMVRSRSGLAGLVLVMALFGGAVMAGEDAINRQAMADAMSRMMESMGLFGAGTGAANGSMTGTSGDSWGRAGEAGRQMMEGLGKDQQAGRLDGMWEAAGGGLLIVQGGNYRLYAPNGAYADGVIHLSAQRVQMVSRRAGFTLDLEYAFDQGRLAMRDTRGRVYLYRRLVLNGGG